MTLHGMAKRFRIDDPDKFHLSARDPAECYGLTADKSEAKAMLAEGLEQLSDLQERLYAYDSWSVLIILQAMDAAGKDSVDQARDVWPQSAGLSRCIRSSSRASRNSITISCGARPGACRSAAASAFSIAPITRKCWWCACTRSCWSSRSSRPRSWQGRSGKKRFEDIRAFERHLARNGTMVLKFFLHVSKEEQRQRFLERLDEPAKSWKFSMGDVDERKHWDEIHGGLRGHDPRHQSTPDAPWYVVPGRPQVVHAHGDRRRAIVRELRALDLDFPSIKGKALKELQKARKALKARSAVSEPPGHPSEVLALAAAGTSAKRTSCVRVNAGLKSFRHPDG